MSSRFSSRAALAQLSAPPATLAALGLGQLRTVVCDGDHFGNYQRAEMQILREAGIPFWVNDVQKVEEVNGTGLCAASYPCSTLPTTRAVRCLSPLQYTAYRAR